MKKLLLIALVAISSTCLGQSSGGNRSSGGVVSAPSIPRVGRWNYAVANNTAWSNTNSVIASQGFIVEQGTGAALGAVAGTEENSTKVTSGAVSGNQANATDNANPDFYVQGRNVYLALRLKDNNADLTNQRLWIGLTNIVTSFANTDTTLNGDTPCATVLKCAMFRYSSVASDTTYKCVTGTGAANTITDSGITADTNFHRFEIQFNDSIPNVVFKIDGAVVCTNTTNLPSGVNFNPYVALTTQTAAAKEVDIAWLYIQEDF